MRKVIHLLAVPAALIVGLWLGILIQQNETAFWHEMAYKVASLSEKTVETTGSQLGVCLDVVDGNLTYEEGTAKLLELHDDMAGHKREQDLLRAELEAK